MNPNKNDWHPIKVLLPPEMYQRLREYAHKEGTERKRFVGVAEIIRRAIKAFLAL